MPNARTTPTDSADVTLDDVCRIYRQSCLLRAKGDDAGAEALRSGELQASLAQLPESAANPGRIRQAFAVEEERLAQAEALAHLLGPMLVRQLAAREAAAPAGNSRMPAPAGPAPRPRARATVADFIDEMLAAEAAARPTR